MDDLTSEPAATDGRATNPDAPAPPSSPLEAQLDLLLSSLERPAGSAAAEILTHRLTHDPGQFAADQLVETRMASAIAAVDRASKLPTITAQAGPEPKPPGATTDPGEIMDLDALLAAEAAAVFGEEPGTEPDRFDRNLEREAAFLDLASLEREAAGLPPEPGGLLMPMLDAAQPVLDSGREVLNLPFEPPLGPLDAAPPGAQPGRLQATPVALTAGAAVPSKVPAMPAAQPSADPASKESQGAPAAGPTGRGFFLPIALILDAPVRRLGGSLPALLGDNPAARCQQARLCLGLAGLCLGLPGLTMILVGLLSFVAGS